MTLGAKESAAARLGAAMARIGSVQKKDLPWYVLIGPTGVGKTAALHAAGLDLVSPEGSGNGPTADFDVWLGESGVVVDTAGGYVAQDAEGDKKSWSELLEALKRQRPRRPINGIILALAFDSLPDQPMGAARALRARLRDLAKTAGTSLPVYVLMTKADRLAGFAAFFDSLRPAARQQIWGETLPLRQTDGGLDEALRRGFERLARRIEILLLDRLQGEGDPTRRQQMFDFPQQLDVISDGLRDILAELASGGPTDAPPLLRGIYLASARQDGGGIDPVARRTAAAFATDLPALAENQGGGDAYFLERLFDEVIFREANLAGYDSKNVPGRRLMRRGAAAAAIAACFAFVALCAYALLDQQRYLAGIDARLSTYAEAASAIPIREITHADFPRIAPLLDAARNLAGTPPSLVAAAIALDQSGKAGAASQDVYGRALDLLLLPHILLHLQDQARAKAGANDRRSDQLYTMLAGKAPLDAAIARPALAAKFDTWLAGPRFDGLRQALAAHIAAMLGRPIGPVAVNDDLIADAVERLSLAVTSK